MRVRVVAPSIALILAFASSAVALPNYEVLPQGASVGAAADPSISWTAYEVDRVRDRVYQCAAGRYLDGSYRGGCQALQLPGLNVRYSDILPPPSSPSTGSAAAHLWSLDPVSGDVTFCDVQAQKCIALKRDR